MAICSNFEDPQPKILLGTNIARDDDDQFRSNTNFLSTSSLRSVVSVYFVSILDQTSPTNVPSLQESSRSKMSSRG